MNATVDPLTPYWRAKVEAASAAIDQELRGEVDAASPLALLSPRQREVTALVDGQGLNLAEAARRMGISRTAADIYLSKARNVMGRGRII